MKIVILGYVWPEPASSAAGGRSLTLIAALRQAGHDLIYASGSRENEASARLAAEGLVIQPILGNDSSFDEWLRELQPDAVLFDRFLTEEQFGARVREACPGALRVLDTVDLHFLRRARENALAAGRPLPEVFAAGPGLFFSARGEPSPDALREIGAIYRCDLTLVISEFEQDLLRELFHVPASLLAHFPLCYEGPPPATPAFSARRDFVMIGNFRHRPNADGLNWFKREIWPRIRAGLPEARVRVYGAYPSRATMDLADPARGLEIRGPATSAFDVLAAHRVSLAPLRFGAGQKGKISDSWWAGTPVVTTPIGAEGMRLTETGLVPEFGGKVTLDADSFARAAIELHEGESPWGAALATGRETLARHCDFARESRALGECLARAAHSLPELRAGNFVGAMLAHHREASTKYFSRWIEAKSRI